MRYSVFESMDRTEKACVVVNVGNEQAVAEVTWTGSHGRAVEILMPFHPDAVAELPVKLRLAPRTCAVIAQK